MDNNMVKFYYKKGETQQRHKNTQEIQIPKYIIAFSFTQDTKLEVPCKINMCNLVDPMSYLTGQW